MRSSIALAAVVALTLSSSLAFAGGKKAAPPVDPRTNLITKPFKPAGQGMQSWCNIDSNCNGWAAWLAQKTKG